MIYYRTRRSYYRVGRTIILLLYYTCLYFPKHVHGQNNIGSTKNGDGQFKRDMILYSSKARIGLLWGCDGIIKELQFS